MAHVSASYYTALEQDRGTRPTSPVLDALADALQLGTAERAHLHALATPVSVTAKRAIPDIPALQALVDDLDPRPAYATDDSWDVRCLNRAAQALFPGLTIGTNLLRWMLLDPGARTVFVEWEQEAKAQLARLRATRARLGAGTERLDALVEDLVAASPEVRRWWSEHDVAPLGGGTKRLREHGIEHDRRYQVLLPADSNETHLVVFERRPG